MARVLLVDCGYTDTAQEIPYLFRKAGSTVDVFCPKNSWVRRNSYVTTWIPAPCNNLEEFSTQLITTVKNTQYDWVVLMDDVIIRTMNDMLTDEDIARVILPLSKLEHRYMLGSKVGLSRLCSEAGVVTPSYAIIDGAHGFKEEHIRNIGFPLLVKIDRSSGGQGVFLCETKESLDDVLKNLSAADAQHLVLQKYIHGENVAVEALYREGILLAYAYSLVRSTITTEYSPSVCREYMQYPGIEHELRKIGESFGINGFCNMTFMRTPDGHTHYLVEADIRPQLWFRLSELAGVHFSEGIRNYISRIDVLVQPEEIEHGSSVILIHFFRSIARSLEKGDVREILRWCLNADNRWRFVPVYDTRAVAEIIVEIGRYMVDMYRRKSRIVGPLYRYIKWYSRRLRGSYVGCDSL